MIRTNINIAGVEFKNPIITASGTFGSGKEFSELIDLNRLGGITASGVSYEPWIGNESPRIAETYGGVLNSIGLQNLGVKNFIADDIPFLNSFDTISIANVSGHTIDEYIGVVEALNDQPIDMIELNISCPNIRAGGLTFGVDTIQVEKIVSEIRKVCKKPLIVKLSPNVTDITTIARVAEASGADAISLINTLIGMKIDIYERKTVLKNKMGGLSGPCIKPIAVRMVYQVAKTVKIPVIGMGGATTWEDAVEFMMAGASAVAFGTANFSNPYATIEAIDGIEKYLVDNNIEDIKDIIGIIE